ncbi:MAG: flagellar biosynthesis protein FlhA [Oscillospiraceae bacterium]|jgi:flagellar biosynthesis protein FlhA|nr:flagellar biosynthesis protein FlhA [Oscillospiraceae bacterium]
MTSNIKVSNITVAAAILSIIFIIIFPMPTVVMDTLLIINISISIIILLFSLYIKEPLEFSVFPTLLLFVTLFRLALNLSSTRLILLNGGNAGNVIKTFGGVVIGQNIVVGVIVFAIIMIIQFIVITKGAERVAEVTARFTLDEMPGKQMAVDADLSTGVIDEAEARTRRQEISHEADFHGAMDGASKFVKGDAIAGVIITLVNIIGGLIIGVVTSNRSIGEVANIYILATIGDGIVSQVPALMISMASGIIVTRSGRGIPFGEETASQIFAQPSALILSGVLLVVVSLIPGLPKLPMLLVAAVLIVGGAASSSRRAKAVAVAEEAAATEEARDKKKAKSPLELLDIAPISFTFGYSLIPLIQASQGGDLIDRFLMIRNQCAYDLGIIIPKVTLRDNVRLAPNEYIVEVKGVEVASGKIMTDHLLAIATDDTDDEMFGIPTVEPTFGLPALWIPKSEREHAELLGYSTVDPPSVIATHMTAVLRRHAHELLSRQDVSKLIDNLKRSQPALVEDVVPKLFSLGEVHRVLSNLLREDVPIRDMTTIVETLGDYGAVTRDTELLTEYVRAALKRTISRRFIPDDEAYAITLDPQLEQLLAESTKQSPQGAYLSLEPGTIRTIFERMKACVETARERGKTPVILVTPLARRQVRKITEQLSADLNVLSYSELDPGVEVRSEGVVKL